MFFCPPFPPWAHPVPPCLPSCWSPYFIIPTLAHTHWEYPVVRCELVGNNKQWRGSRILAGRAQVGPYWYLTPFFHCYILFLPVLTSTISLQVCPHWYLTPFFHYFYLSYQYFQVQCLYRWAHTDTCHPLFHCSLRLLLLLLLQYLYRWALIDTLLPQILVLLPQAFCRLQETVFWAEVHLIKSSTILQHHTGCRGTTQLRPFIFCRLL